ncbi:hypothetical protein EHS25_007086 [Saitozyma podzolica]|uniref:Xylanolytic transcriptional activator regulatory domain-containing protein n=1 Tax=Saitozyma podzolica TaxID=1890683 RepID=A0A427XPJ8_9TREE|nr:hypothetical protein EHS25_007086 [Saitozyma podzolica]
MPATQAEVRSSSAVLQLGETRELLGTVSDLLSQHGITIRPETLAQVEEALENRGSGAAPPIAALSASRVGGAESPNEESFGTLVLSQSGRSTYLGPTAGPEWLRNQEATAAGPSLPSRPASPGRGTEGLDHARMLLESYYRYFAWNHDPAPRSTVVGILEEAYNPLAGSAVEAQKLALLFIVFALGALHNLELPANDPSAEEYLSLSQACLAMGDFMRFTTIAGVQALLETEIGRNGDSAWPLDGPANGQMGLHRDGAKWNLPAETVEERRRVFWETYTIDVFQELFQPPTHRYCFPHTGRWGFTRLPQREVRTCTAITGSLDIQPPSYDGVQKLFAKLTNFERNIPHHLKCRAALLATPSMYPSPDLAVIESPDVNKRDLRATFQQYTLALNISENVLFLQRPYYVRALHERPFDPTLSTYGESYLAVVERCSVMIVVVRDLNEFYPNVIARHWFYWYHLFTAAMCLGTLVLKNPLNPLAQFSLQQLSAAVQIYESLIKRHQSHAMAQNHDWLSRLLRRAAPGGNLLAASADPPSVRSADSATDFLLHQFWDPMVLSDVRADSATLGGAEWWNWETAFGGQVPLG